MTEYNDNYFQEKCYEPEHELAEARATIRRLELRLALATSRVTPWEDGWGVWSPRSAAIRVSFECNTKMRLGDGKPEPL